MKIISSANETISDILKSFRKTDACTRMMKYCVPCSVDDGVLLFNLLTRELLLLTEEEYSHLTELEYLKKHWFIVPEDTKEKELADFVKMILASREKKSGEITGYTIFPTTDCNARCFYCFELGRTRLPMSDETARKVAEYIKTHCGGKAVKITWFGGEPLYNQPAMDIISDGLHREGITFTSRMITNGYLFDDATVKKAVDRWNVKNVQISLDGTEEVYNRVKAYIYREGNPYRIVLDNIGRLLKASVSVVIRLNLDMHNADDLLSLVDDLSARFGGNSNLTVYAFHLFNGDQPMAESHSAQDWAIRGEAMRRIEEKITQSGFGAEKGICKKLKLTHCMADSGKAVTILPDGRIGLCEHHSENEFIGHIDTDGFDAAVVARWKETTPQIPECADCFYYPECIKLKKCANGSTCFPQFRQGRLRQTERQMLCEYRKALTQTQSDQDDEEELFGVE